MLASAALVAIGEKEDSGYESFQRAGSIKIFMSIAILVVGTVLFATVGMVLSLLAMVFLWMIILGKEPAWISAAVAIGTVIAVYLIFDLGLEIPLPSDVVLNLLGL